MDEVEQEKWEIKLIQIGTNVLDIFSVRKKYEERYSVFNEHLFIKEIVNSSSCAGVVVGISD